jgi:hypothetical protein
MGGERELTRVSITMYVTLSHPDVYHHLQIFVSFSKNVMPMNLAICFYVGICIQVGKVQDIYEKLDDDESGGLTFQEFRQVLLFLNQNYTRV